MAEIKWSQIKLDPRGDDWIKGIERWKGLEEVEISVQAVGNRADHSGSKGAGHTLNKATGSNRGGIEGIVGQQRDLEVHHILKVLDLVPFLM